jgi:transketolase
MIIVHTLKGKGLSLFEKDDINRKHGVPLTAEEAAITLTELSKT